MFNFNPILVKSMLIWFYQIVYVHAVNMYIKATQGNLKIWPLWAVALYIQGSSWPWAYGSWIYNYLCNQCLSPLMLWVRISIRARCTTLCDKVCQWLATGRWLSPGPPVSPTNKTDRHDLSEILLNVALNTFKQTLYTGILYALFINGKYETALYRQCFAI